VIVDTGAAVNDEDARPAIGSSRVERQKATQWSIAVAVEHPCSLDWHDLLTETNFFVAE